MAEHDTVLSSGEIRRGLESLPQALYDMVYEHVFTAPPGDRFITDPKLRMQDEGRAGLDVRKATRLLHVSTASRNLYATTFYGPNAVLKVHTRKIGANIMVRNWLQSIPEEHRHRLNVIVRIPGWKSSDLSRPSGGCYDFLGGLIRYLAPTVGHKVAMKIRLEVCDLIIGFHPE